jgi:uncharacterized phiE125 gp8 family phage protein
MRGLTRLVQPPAEPVPVDEAMAYLRQDDPTDEPLVRSLLKAARELIESTYDLTCISTTWQMTMDRFPRYSTSAVWQYNSDAIWQQRLPVTQLSGQWYPDRASIRVVRPPLVSVQSITFFDTNGLSQTVDPTIYNVDTTTPRGRIAPAFGQIWPIVQMRLESVVVTYVAGYGDDGSQVPEALRLAIKALVLDWYENRGDEPEIGAIPKMAERLVLSVWDGEYE